MRPQASKQPPWNGSDGVRKAKAKLEQDLAGGANYKKGLCKYTGHKRRPRSVCSLKARIGGN